MKEQSTANDQKKPSNPTTFPIDSPAVYIGSVTSKKLEKKRNELIEKLKQHGTQVFPEKSLSDCEPIKKSLEKDTK